MKTHIDLLGLINIVSGLFWAVLGFAILALFLLVAPATGDATGFFAVITIGIVIGGFWLFLGVFTLIAGIGLLKHQAWARILTLIIAIFAFFNFPLGTLVAIYTFWVLTNTETVTLMSASA